MSFHSSKGLKRYHFSPFHRHFIVFLALLSLLSTVPVSVDAARLRLSSSARINSVPSTVSASVSPSSSSSIDSSATDSNWVTPELFDSSDTQTAFENQASKMRFHSITAQHMPKGQVRASYDDRRRMLPYGGMDFSMNPYRTPNAWHLPKDIQFFSPKISNGMTFGPDPGLSMANVINSQHALLQASFNDGMRRMGLGYENGLLSRGFGMGGPGWGHFNRLQRPYGIDPYAPPFSYYSPPPLPSTTTVPDWSTAGPAGSGGGSGSGSSGGDG